MKKFFIVSIVAVLLIIPVSIAACTGDAPITGIEFEITELNMEDPFIGNATETINVTVYPSDADCSDLKLEVDKEGYLEIRKGGETVVTGENCRKVAFEIEGLYSGTIQVTAVSEKYSVRSETITITVTGADKKPVTTETEREYLTKYGWDSEKISNFAAAREKVRLSPLKEITDTEGETYTFINGEDDTCKVIFEDNAVSGIYDCEGERKIYPSNSKVVIYEEDIDTSMLIDIISFCKTVVESKLKYPLSADFPLIDWSWALDKSACDQLFITSYVDADNAFGVSSRLQFIVNIRVLSEDNYEWITLMLGGELYTNSNV